MASSQEISQNCETCKKSLARESFMPGEDDENKLYCIPCYEKLFSKTCYECCRLIGPTSEILSYKGRHWHGSCLKCSGCSKLLADVSFSEQGDGIFYCDDCFDKHCAGRCSWCDETFKAGMKRTEYEGKLFHEDCFKCTKCKNPIGGASFAKHQNRVVCVSCYDQHYADRCKNCGEPVTADGVVSNSNVYHEKCFVCTECKRSLSGQRFMTKNLKPYCITCASW